MSLGTLRSSRMTSFSTRDSYELAINTVFSPRYQNESTVAPPSRCYTCVHCLVCFSFGALSEVPTHSGYWHARPPSTNGQMAAHRSRSRADLVPTFPEAQCRVGNCCSMSAEHRLLDCGACDTATLGTGISPAPSRWRACFLGEGETTTKLGGAKPTEVPCGALSFPSCPYPPHSPTWGWRKDENSCKLRPSSQSSSRLEFWTSSSGQFI